MNQDHLRNFCIIAHIDHGKSTLADRLLEKTGTINMRDMKAQLLDTMDLERERGITIKLQPVQMHHEVDGDTYQLNLIDTPGHVDFSYEVSRSLNACEGALLVVDAAQGIEAQTLANVYLAIEANLEIIPVINKIDLPAANVEKVAKEIVSLLGCKEEDIFKVSAKTGVGIDELLDEIVLKVPAPKGDIAAPTRALIFDSSYDEYRGVIVFVRVVDGAISHKANVRFMAHKKDSIITELGFFKPAQVKADKLMTGQIGYLVTNLKSVEDAQVGDTVTLADNPADQALPGYQPSKAFVYAGIFPVSGEDYPALKDALEKLKLNDAALQYLPENSKVLGFGYRVGFLGLLHLDIVKERLEREFDLELVVTNPSTDYQITTTTGHDIELTNAGEMPDPTQIQEIREPWIKGEVVVPKDYVGAVMQLINSVRGEHNNIQYVDETLSIINFKAPLANVLTDFFDQLKSVTSGYGSFNYDLDEYKPENLVKLDILVAGDVVDSLSSVVHRSEAQAIGRRMTQKLSEVIPRQQFVVAIQAAIGGKIIARDDVRAYGKNVTAGLYGGDVSRKKKQLSKQKEGKKRMKKFGKVDIPPEAFMVMLKKD